MVERRGGLVDPPLPEKDLGVRRVGRCRLRVLARTRCRQTLEGPRRVRLLRVQVASHRRRGREIDVSHRDVDVTP
ncbi:MAG: hypothetical protein ACK5IM_12450, partial [Demequina sp.]|uniref:hypothetical protein n=1 Tax=Demequina sp. TaxID=2050685 RepID=UPI003A88EC6A